MRTARGSGPCSATLLVPGGIEALTGGNLYDGTMVATLRNRGWRVDVAEERPRPDVDVVIQDSLSISAGPPHAVQARSGIFSRRCSQQASQSGSWLYQGPGKAPPQSMQLSQESAVVCWSMAQK